jgi:hypothetical protein
METQAEAIRLSGPVLLIQLPRLLIRAGTTLLFLVAEVPLHFTLTVRMQAAALFLALFRMIQNLRALEPFMALT